MFSETEKKLIDILQNDLPLCSRPFRKLAEQAGLSETEVLEKLDGLRRRGVIRRLGAVLMHRKLGIRANAMVLWAVPEEKVREYGARLATYPEVTHCYHRKVPQGWEYRLFTMIHARRREDCLGKIRQIAGETGLKDYLVLFSTRELKKSGIIYKIQEAEG